jgi:FlaA1/EpsC-like NDP-sugar epimerase
MSSKPTPFPPFTKVWHTEPYPAISPTRPELSVTGKSVLITGGGTGIGAAIAKAFAAAGSTQIAIVGRTEKTLLATKQELETLFPGGLTNEEFNPQRTPF